MDEKEKIRLLDEKIRCEDEEKFEEKKIKGNGGKKKILKERNNLDIYCVVILINFILIMIMIEMDRVIKEKNVVRDEMERVYSF